MPMCKCILSMCTSECEKGSESIIMRIIPLVMRKGCTRLPHTSTGRAGGPGSGDYRSDKAGTGTRSEGGKKLTLGFGARQI